MHQGFTFVVLLALTKRYKQCGTMMGQLLATFHNKQLKLSGHSQFAFLQLEMAFFIGLKNPIKKISHPIFDDKSEIECPVNVPCSHFCGLIGLIDLGKANLSLGIYNPLLNFFGMRCIVQPLINK